MNRYRFPIAILILSVMTFGLFITASPTPDAQAAPRSIPWDCSDWQETPAVADAEDARVSMILESLAANRGKSIYCAIDQSDTWTKTETWEAGRYRNERDDTVYFGEQGNFRGFLAAQEGYLTDGESGVTGVSRDLIFEFPREERRGKKTIRIRVRSDSADTGDCITPTPQSLSERTPAPPGTLICSDLPSAWSGSWVQNLGSSVQHRARNVYVGRGAGDTDWRFDWRTRVRTWTSQPPAVAQGSRLSEDEWIAKAEAAAFLLAGPGAGNMSPAAPISAPATTANAAATRAQIIWAPTMAGFTTTDDIARQLWGEASTITRRKPGKAALGVVSAPNASAAANPLPGYRNGSLP